VLKKIQNSFSRVTPLRWFVILSVIAIALALGLPPDPDAVRQLHATETTYRLAVAALLVPYVFIWYTSFYAYAKLKEYSKPIKDTKDGDAFKQITAGIGALSFTLIVPTIVSLILSNIAAHHKSFEAASTVINNYVSLYPGLVAFLLLYNGARMLARTTKEGTRKIDLRLHIFWFLLLSVIFSRLVIQNQYQSHPYHLTVALLMVTFIVPYLYAWAIGMLSGYELRLYANTVRGSLYQRGINQFAVGILVTISGSIAIQFVNAALMHRVHQSVGMILLIDYVLLILVASGLLLIAFGTKKLKLLEEV
jgi:hypothetical protein